MLAAAASELAQIPAADASRAEVRSLLLTVLHEQQKWPEAQTVAAELIHGGAKDAGIWIMWAYATRRADSLVGAEHILREAVKVHPDDPTIQFNLGCYACQRGDLRAARQHVDRAIALAPHFAALAATDTDLVALRVADAADRPTDS
ncbi:MAG: hypothetical protein RL077_3839 [Verrucomicrobiota bacterium]